MKKYHSKPWKQEERDALKALQAAAGRVSNPALLPLVTTTGRTGHLTNLQVDGLVGPDGTGWAVEVKYQKNFLSKKTEEAFDQITAVASQFHRKPVLVITSPPARRGQRKRRLVLLRFDDFIELLERTK
ncbi:MAG: hypothetical protein KatS3mg109_0770 [Pirellulaceae bacterium]|nr:MAG: hypothetical protein KatS3mg109_0770 [Pirellulaceae bacterium]